MRSLFLIVSALTLAADAFAATSEFAGCQGVQVTRSKDFSLVDVSVDFGKAKKRIKEICKDGSALNQLDAKLVQTAESCMAGQDASEPGKAAHFYVTTYQKHVAKGCADMQAALNDAKKLCEARGARIAEVQASLQAIEADGQAASIEAAKGAYQKASQAYADTAAQAAAAKDKIHDRLPSKGDPKRAEYMRKGNETADTPAPELDKLAGELKKKFATLKEAQEDQAAQSACEEVSREGGLVDQISKIVKSNLYPNGKTAARAVARVESTDKDKKAEYDLLAANTGKNVESAASLNETKVTDAKAPDITGTEDLAQSEIDAAVAEETAPTETVKLEDGKKLEDFAKDGNRAPDAVIAAIDETKQSQEVPAEAVVPAEETVATEEVPAVDQAVRVPASVPAEKACPLGGWEWSGWFPSWNSAKYQGELGPDGSCVPRGVLQQDDSVK